MNICKVPGCNDGVRSKGYCKVHYDRWLRGGRVAPDPSVPKLGKAAGMTCIRVGCNLPVRCIGLCSKHYAKSRNNGECPMCGGEKKKESIMCQHCNYERTLVLPEKKVCTRCKIEKPRSDFSFRRDARGAIKIRTPCRACSAEVGRISKKDVDRQVFRDEKKRERIRDREFRFSDNDGWLRKSIRLATKKLHIDPILVMTHFDIVGNKCECCGHIPSIEEARICLDHDHKTGHFRGFLCSPCNTFLGYIEKYPDRIQTLKNYLERVRPI